MWLSPRLAWRKRQMGRRPARRDGPALSDREQFEFEFEKARLAFWDEEGSRRVAHLAEEKALVARDVLGGDGGRQ